MQQGGSPYGVPPPPPLDMTLFSTSTSPPSAAAVQQQQQMTATAAAAEPINSRPPQQQPPPSSTAGPNYEELGSAEDPLGEEGGAGVGVSGGNRWPRQETLALLKIRSDMDAAFRDATLKGPLWEEVSRKLAELGYKRNAKKCKEKFENVHKYYKRTKEGRAGRQDGKSYRFFSQLEALHNTTRGSSVFPPSPSSASIMTTGVGVAASGQIATPITSAPNLSPRFQTPQQQQISAPTPIATAPPPPMMTQMFAQEHHPNVAGISFSSNTSSDAVSDEDDEEEEDDEATEERPSGGGGEGGGKKRKRQGGSGGAGGRKMMAFFEGLMRQVMERQEAMQQRFLEAIEKREHERMIREEAWRRQEMARLAHEHEIAAAERTATAARDAAVMSFLQKVSCQTVPIPPSQTTLTAPAVPPSAPAPSASISIVPTPPQPQPIQQQQTQLAPPLPPSQPQQQQQQQPPPQQQHYQPQQLQQPPAMLALPPRPTSSELIPFSSEPQEGVATAGVSLDPASSRWPKSEVHALIKLRSGLDSRYQESGPKGPLWEEISSGMKQLGYNRSSKRCKEKWENINKYFKKVKESNKKRPEDAKTCPYFHQLDALYRSKLVGSGGNTSVPALPQRPREHETHLNPNPNPISIMPPPPPQQQQPTMNQGEMDTKKDGGGGGSSNGGMPSTFFGDDSSVAGGNGDDSTNAMLKKPEDIMKELMGQPNTDNYGRVDEQDSDNMDEDVDDEEDDDDDEDDGKTQYRIQFQRQNVSSGNGSGASAAPSGGRKAAAGSFLAMVR